MRLEDLLYDENDLLLFKLIKSGKNKEAVRYINNFYPYDFDEIKVNGNVIGVEFSKSKITHLILRDQVTRLVVVNPEKYWDKKMIQEEKIFFRNQKKITNQQFTWLLKWG